MVNGSGSLKIVDIYYENEYSTIDDKPNCTIMYMYLRGGSIAFHNGTVLVQT
jgi:hypothetical protein